jgi:hypothetical protein
VGAECRGQVVSSFVFPIWESNYVIEVFNDLSHSLYGHGKIVPSSLPFILPKFFLHNFYPLKFEVLLIYDT